MVSIVQYVKFEFYFIQNNYVHFRVHVATLVVVTLSVIHCEESSNLSQIQVGVNNKKVDLCPCLPVDICPRVFGTKPEVRLFLNNESII